MIRIRQECLNIYIYIYTYTVTLVLIYEIYIIFVISDFFNIAILFYISKTSIDRKTNNEQKQNSIGKLLKRCVIHEIP